MITVQVGDAELISSEMSKSLEDGVFSVILDKCDGLLVGEVYDFRSNWKGCITEFSACFVGADAKNAYFRLSSMESEPC